MRNMRILFAASLILSILSLQAQTSLTSVNSNKSEGLKNWHLQNKKSAKAYGANIIELRKALGESKPKKKMVVAIIDSGVDSEHEDLVEVLWTNEGEIPNNNIDDDANGDVDDIHGWNFLVDEQQGDIGHENLEATRVLRLDSVYRKSGVESPEWLDEKMVKLAEEIYQSNEVDYQMMLSFAETFHSLDSIAIAVTGDENYTYSDVFKHKSKEPEFKQTKKIFRIFKFIKLSKGDLEETAIQSETYEKYYLNKSFVTRDEFNYNKKGYGNNDYEGQHAEHGTHVAGIVGANSRNDLGADGTSSGGAEIMLVRTVPDGDEYDLDVVNAIHYATNNGANIINMSFGKGISPHSDEVKRAFMYASNKGVLLIHAAGNDSQDNDVITNYPNGSGLTDVNLITVGALAPHKNKKLVADFSNYGKQSVNIFAPGDEIYSTIPGNEYKFLSGTSMAAPVVSGVAAMIWSYFPDYSAKEIRDVLLNSSGKIDRSVILPGTKKTKVEFSELSSTGGVLDALAAFRLAQEREAE